MRSINRDWRKGVEHSSELTVEIIGTADTPQNATDGTKEVWTIVIVWIRGWTAEAGIHSHFGRHSNERLSVTGPLSEADLCGTREVRLKRTR